jgi:hypothetical protein
VEKYPSTPYANRAQRHLLRLDHGIADINATVHPAIAPARIAPLVAEHAAGIVAQAAPLAKIGDSLATRDAALYATPRATDIESRMDDDEIRRDYHGKTAAQRATLREQMQAGQADRTALALKRAPVPIDPQDAAAAGDAWRQQVDRAHPAKAAALAAERAHHERDSGVVRDALRYAGEYPEAPATIAKAVHAASAEGFFGLAQAAA